MSMITELIKKLNEHADLLKEMGFDPDGMVMNDYREAADTIQLLSEKLHDSQMERSSQYYNDGWIPVSERLPEIRQHVLCQCRGKNYLVLRLNHKGDWECIYPRTTYMQSFVIAWMPLPEPYKESEGK